MEGYVQGVPRVLTDEGLRDAVAQLTQHDTDFAMVIEQYGMPPMWAREPGFSTLIHIILEQQVSLASARAAFDKLLAIASPLTPVNFLELDDAMLKSVGFSRQKTLYGRLLAEEILAGRVDLSAFADMHDEQISNELTRLKGIGPWTANIYLLMVLRRPDIWPVGDVALATAAKEVKGLGVRPSQEELSIMAEAWRPWRSVAARILWHSYLSRRGKS